MKENDIKYEKLRSYLIEKGVDSSLLELPAVRERLQKMVFIPLDSIIIRDDGTFECEHQCKENLGIDLDTDGLNFLRGSLKIVRSKEDGGISINEFKKYQGFVQYLPDERVPDTIWEENDIIIDTIVDKNGFEVEKYISEKEAYDYSSGRTFFYKNSIFFRENGLIYSYNLPCYSKEKMGISKEEMKEKARQRTYNCYCYDVCEWELDGHKCKFGCIFGEEAKVKHSQNAQMLVQKYPNLKDYCDLSKKMLDIRIEREQLAEKNEKLQYMLEKALSFAETVRNSSVGRLFFGKKAKEVLGEKNKNSKYLPEGRED